MYITTDEIEEIKKDYGLYGLKDREIANFYCEFIKADENINPKELTILYL